MAKFSFKSLLIPLIAIVIIVFLIYLPKIIGIRTLERAAFEELEKKSSIFSSDSDQGGGIGETLRSFLYTEEKTENNKKTTKKTSEKSTNENIDIEKTNIHDWSYLHSKPPQTKFKQATKIAKELSGKLRSTSQSKVEVEKFLEILSKLRPVKNENTEKKLSPKKLFQELERQDLKVLTILLKEDANRGLLYQWYKLDLSDFYSTTRTKSLKKLAITNFDPGLQIHDVVYHMLPDSWQNQVENILSIDITFVVLNDNIRTIYLYHNDNLQKELAVKSKIINSDWSIVELKINDLNGIYTIVVEDLTGSKSIKNYNFNKAFHKLNISKESQDKKGNMMRLVSFSDNFQNNVNVIDRLYQYKDPIEEDIREQFPDGQFKEF